MSIKPYRGKGTQRNEVFIYFSGTCKTVQRRGTHWFFYDSTEGWLNKGTLAKAIIHAVNN